MSKLFDSPYAPITSSIGLIKAPLETTKDYFVAWQSEVLGKYGQTISATALECSLGEAILKLAPLTKGVCTKYLFLALGENWTAFFDNGWRGSDPSGAVAVLSKKLGTTTFRLTMVTNTKHGAYAPGPGRYGATIFTVHENSQQSRRSIYCMNDGGRWSFEESGTPYPFEDTASYQKKRIAGRFGPDLLEKYVETFGINPFLEASYTNQSNLVRGYLAEKGGNLPESITYISLAEVRQGAGYSSI